MNIDITELKEIAESIQVTGLLQPILVKQGDNHFQIIAAERRWRVHKMRMS